MVDRETLERVLEDTGEQWLEAKAAGRDITKIEDQLREAERQLDTLNRQGDKRA